MPQSPKKPCKAAGCNTLHTNLGGYCDSCRSRRQSFIQQHRDNKRESPSRRGYDVRWMRVRDRYLKQHQFCECERCRLLGRRRPATMVHHVIPVDADWSRRLDETNLLAMYKQCHEVEHGRARDMEMVIKSVTYGGRSQSLGV